MDEFVFAVMRKQDGTFVVNDVMPEQFGEPEKPYSSGEIEYIVNRIAWDLQNRRLSDEILSKISPEQETVSQRVSAALKRRKES